MGRGMGAVVPLEFSVEKDRFKPSTPIKKLLPKSFVKNYNAVQDGNEFLCKIREEILLPNFANLLTEFYRLIEVDYREYTADRLWSNGASVITRCSTVEEDAAKVTDMASFEKEYGDENRGGTAPFIAGYMTVSCPLCTPRRSWVFYFGSYKAYFEEYKSLYHLSNLVKNAINNPLASAVLFAEIG